MDTGTVAHDPLATELATELATDIERIVGLFRSLSPASGLSMTAAATLADLERLGPQRLTLLAAREGVTQPAMTQLISRLEESGLVRREPSPDDGRVVLVAVTEQGRATLAHRRSARAERLARIIAQLSPDHRAALAAALPALDALASVTREDDPARAAR
jgi:DNA-binding MarR family transcriptional regulator